MTDREYLPMVLLAAKKAGLAAITPVVLSDGGSLLVHLSPHPVVARVAIVISEEDTEHAYKVLARELRVARHLCSKGVPSLLPSDLTEAGPHDVYGTWMTFWNYAPPTRLQPPSPSEAFRLVDELSAALNDFPDELPRLGVWERTCKSAVRLSKHPDQRVQALLRVFVKLNEKMRLEPKMLVPSHGDAHARNLLPSPEGWIWTDFEDVSLMPPFWDHASYVCNFALFRGVQEPTFRYFLDQFNNAPDLEVFGFAIIARVLMSTLGNLDFALAGHGDLEFATKQLELASDFVREIDLLISETHRLHNGAL